MKKSVAAFQGFGDSVSGFRAGLDGSLSGGLEF